MREREIIMIITRPSVLLRCVLRGMPITHTHHNHDPNLSGGEKRSRTGGMKEGVFLTITKDESFTSFVLS